MEKELKSRIQQLQAFFPKATSLLESNYQLTEVNK